MSDLGNIKRYLINSSWMLAEQLLRIVAAVFVGIYIARYLGPENFGVLSYALAVSAFMIATVKLGMDAVLVRELVNSPADSARLMGTAFWMMLGTSILCCLSLFIWLFLSDENFEVKIYIAIVSSSCIFTVFFVGDYKFQAEVRAKRSSLLKAAVLFSMSVVKIILIVRGAELKWFVVAAFLDNAVIGLVFLFSFLFSRDIYFFSRFEFDTAKKLLRSSWPMVLSALSVLIYMRIDQVMIRNMLGMHEVGVYSAATRIYEAWMTLPFVISVSLLPLVLKAREKNKAEYQLRFVQLYRFLIWSSIFAAIIVSLLSETIMVIAFGEAFRESAPVVSVVMWAAVFSAIGSVNARYFNVERMERKFAFRTVLAAGINIVLNLFLIPRMGIVGAAWSTLICTFVANYLMDWFDRDLRELLKIKHCAIFWIPIR